MVKGLFPDRFVLFKLLSDTSKVYGFHVHFRAIGSNRFFFIGAKHPDSHTIVGRIYDKITGLLRRVCCVVPYHDDLATRMHLFNIGDGFGYIGVGVDLVYMGPYLFRLYEVS